MFVKLKTVAWNHNKIKFLWFSSLILRFHLEYPLSKLCFSERTPRVLSETTIKTLEYLGQKKIFVVTFRKKMLESHKLIDHNVSCPRFWPTVICRVYSFYVAILRIKTKFRGSLILFLWSNFKIENFRFLIQDTIRKCILNMYMFYKFY